MGKRMEKLSKNIDKTKTYTVEQAVGIIKKSANAKFDETVELHAKLGIDVKKADQKIRTTVTLPAGTGKTRKIAVIAKGEKVTEAKNAGADLVGTADLIEEIKKGRMDFDILVATPDVMKDLAKVGKILGPRGLMPNPKSGTVTFELEETIKELKKGRVEFKVDDYGIVHAPVGRASFEENKLCENIKAVLAAIIRAKPQSSKDVYLQSVFLTTTMGPSVRVEIKPKYD
jgi:large subunit ribosomal protein L1